MSAEQEARERKRQRRKRPAGAAPAQDQAALEGVMAGADMVFTYAAPDIAERLQG